MHLLGTVGRPRQLVAAPRGKRPVRTPRLGELAEGEREWRAPPSGETLPPLFSSSPKASKPQCSAGPGGGGRPGSSSCREQRKRAQPPGVAPEGTAQTRNATSAHRKRPRVHYLFSPLLGPEGS